MASRFRSGHQEELGSGGKIPNSRLHLQPFSPYSRPSISAAPLALPAPESEARRSPSWFRGLISGAGKLISSVLGSEGSVSSSSECSSDYSSDEEDDPYPNEREDHLLSDGLAEFNKRESVVEGNVESLAIVSKSDSKLVIEQLLMQETFTRAEYCKLMEILQSRVHDIPSAEGGEGTQNEVPKRVSDKRPWQSLNQNRNISGTFNFSPSNPSVFSPRYYASEAVTPDLRNKAVMEAKKWFEEKNLSPSPICDQECGPCVLNTDMDQYCFNGDDGSPIEMAKSYMQSLPPWRSPSFSTIGFKNTPSTGKLSCSIGAHLLPASKVKKRDYAAIGSWDSKDNSSVSLKSIDDEQKNSKLRKAGSTTRPLVLEPSRASSATTNFGNRLQDASCGDIFSDEHLKLHDSKAVEVGHQMEMHKEISRGIIMEPREAFKDAEGVPKVAAVDVNEHLNSDIVIILPSDVDMPISSKNQVNQDVDVTFVTEAQIGSISAQDSLVLVSTALENGDSFPETETSQPENIVPAEPSIQKSYSEVKFRADNAIELNPDSDFKHAHSFTDSKRPDENPHIQKDEIRTAEKIHINGHFAEINNMNSDHESMSNGCGPVAEGIREPPSDVSSDIPSTQGANNNAGKPGNEKKMKSTERMLTEPTEFGRGKRRAKKIVRQKRWKG